MLAISSLIFVVIFTFGLYHFVYKKVWRWLSKVITIVVSVAMMWTGSMHMLLIGICVLISGWVILTWYYPGPIAKESV